MNAPGRSCSMKAKSSAPISGGTIGVDLVVAGDLARHRGGERGLALVVDQDRIAGRVGELGLGAIEPRRALDHFAHAASAAGRALPATGCARCRGAARAAG